MTDQDPRSQAAALDFVGVALELATDGPTAVVSGLRVRIDRQGITTHGPEPGAVRSVPWSLVAGPRFGEPGVLPDGAPALCLTATVAGRVVRWLVPTAQLSAWHAATLNRLLVGVSGGTGPRASSPAAPAAPAPSAPVAPVAPATPAPPAPRAPAPAPEPARQEGGARAPRPPAAPGSPAPPARWPVEPLSSPAAPAGTPDQPAPPASPSPPAAPAQPSPPAPPTAAGPSPRTSVAPDFAQFPPPQPAAPGYPPEAGAGAGIPPAPGATGYPPPATAGYRSGVPVTDYSPPVPFPAPGYPPGAWSSPGLPGPPGPPPGPPWAWIESPPGPADAGPDRGFGHTKRLRRLLLAAAAALVLLGLGLGLGLGLTGSSKHSLPPRSRSSRQQEVAGQLTLRLTDVPSTWRVDPDKNGPISSFLQNNSQTPTRAEKTEDEKVAAQFEHCMGIPASRDRIFGAAGSAPGGVADSPAYEAPSSDGQLQVGSQAEVFDSSVPVSADVAQVTEPKFPVCFGDAIGLAFSSLGSSSGAKLGDPLVDPLTSLPQSSGVHAVGVDLTFPVTEQGTTVATVQFGFVLIGGGRDESTLITYGGDTSFPLLLTEGMTMSLENHIEQEGSGTGA